MIKRETNDFSILITKDSIKDLMSAIWSKYRIDVKIAFGILFLAALIYVLGFSIKILIAEDDKEDFLANYYER